MATSPDPQPEAYRALVAERYGRAAEVEAIRRVLGLDRAE
jgi:hypothetical protein